MGEAINSILGIQTFRIEQEGIASWRIGLISSDTSGYAIDNVDFGDPFWIDFDKRDDVNDFECRSPGEELTYTICWDNVSGVAIPDANLIDFLPEGVTYDYVLSMNPLIIDPNYDPATHTYTWHLGTIPADSSGSVNLTVTVNEKAEPGMLIHNLAEMWGTVYDVNDLPVTVQIARATEDTRICCWDPVDPNIIYVDQFAAGYNNGTNWIDAYNDFQDALTRIKESICPEVFEIRIANGTYYPGDQPNDTFIVPENTKIIGGFRGGDTAPDDRDTGRYRTILSGYIDVSTNNNTVVTMGNNSLLDGVTVGEGQDYGVYGNGNSFSILNCTITNNQERGVNCENANLTIQWCEIKENEQEGMYHSGSSKFLIVKNCNIHDNKFDGIRANLSAPTILDSLIYRNGSGSTYYSPYYGVNLTSPGSGTTIRNNTIVHNTNEGIRRSSGSSPEVRNCVLFANNADDNYADISGVSETWYCCLTDPNHLDQPKDDPPADGQGNIKTNPGFAYTYPVYGYFHLHKDSPCRDAGDPDEQYYVGADETDMDGDDRDGDGTVDIGADEVTCEYYTSDPNDWNGDGIINYEEFSILSRAWLSCDPNSPSYPNPNPNDVIAWYIKDAGPLADMNKDSCVDLEDLIIFSDPSIWLWEACWRENFIAAWSKMGDGSEGSMMMSMQMTESVQETQVAETKSIEEQILDIEEAIEFLEKIWMEDPYVQQEIDEEDWKEFMDAVYNSLYELRT